MKRIEEYLGITIDYSRDALLSKQGLALLTGAGFYKLPHEDSPQKTFARAVTSFCFGDYELAQRLYDHLSLGHWMAASPVLSNGVETRWPTFSESEFEKASAWLKANVKPDGMPISCFLASVEDSKESLVETSKEVRHLSMAGGGVGVYMGNRSPDSKSTGIMAHVRGYDADCLAYKQKESRRGSIAAYADIDHPEIMQFIGMRDPTAGNPSSLCLDINNAVNLTDEFMTAVVKGRQYELIDPKHGRVGRKLDAREVWEDLMQKRYETGEPYLNFIDTVNRNIPAHITKPTYKVRQSNLCNEIHLMTSDKRTAVCCLSSLNIDKYDEWKDSSLVADLVRFLDNVLEYFIQLAPKELSKAIHSASQERAIGLGAFGWHSYLQSKSIAFESGGVQGAIGVSARIMAHIKRIAVESSKVLAEERGEPEDCWGSGMRNSHLIAIAPNANSASIFQASPSVEPWMSNAYVAQGRAGSFLVKNKALEATLESLGKNTQEVWSDIVSSNGSVQHLDFLSDHDKEVFKTFREINMLWVIEHAAAKQVYICQGQSINIRVDKDTTAQNMSDWHMAAWMKGLKGLYYCKSETENKATVSLEKSSPVTQKDRENGADCLGCEG